MYHTGPISGIATHGATLVATAGYDNKVILWNATEGTAIGRGYHDHLANQVSFSPDGKLLATSGSDYTARIWTIPDMRLKAVLSDHDDDVEMVSFSPDGQFIATCSRDHSIGVYDNDGTHVRSLIGHEADVISVTWTPESDQLISSSDDGTIRRWSAKTGVQLDLIDMDGVETDTVVTTASGTIYSGDDEGRITILTAGTRRTIDAHKAGIKRLIYSAEYKLIASLSYDRTLCVWSIADDDGLSLAQNTTFPAIVWPRSGAFLNSDQLVFGTFGSSYATYTLSKQVWDTKGIVADASVNAVTRMPDGRIAQIGDAGLCCLSDGTEADLPSLCNFLLPVGDVLVTAGQTGEIFNGLTGELLHRHKSPINCGAAFLRDGTWHVILGAYTGEGIILRLTDDGGSMVHVCDIDCHENAVKGVAADDNALFSVAADGACAWHAIEDFALLANDPKGHSKIANGCAAIPGAGFASVSRDLKMRLWLVPGTPAEVIDTPHRNSVKCVAACIEGRYVASGNYFGTVAIYDRITATWVAELRVSDCGISCIAPDRTPGAFLCSSYDGKIHHVSVP